MATKSVEALVKDKKISEIVNPKIVQATPDISLKQAIQIMQENKSGDIVIAKAKKVLGVFTETDVAQKVLGQDVSWSKPVVEFMQLDPSLFLNINESVGKAVELMGSRLVYHIPLVNDKKELVNVLSVRTLIRFLAEFYPTEIYNLPPAPNRVIETAEGG